MKKSIIPVAAFIAGMAIVPGAFAASDVTEVKTWDTLVACLKGDNAGASEVVRCALEGNIEYTEEWENAVKIGENAGEKAVSLDLAGYNITINDKAGVFATQAGDFTITGTGTITGKNSVVTASGAGDFAMGAGVTLKGVQPVKVTSTNEINVAIDGTVENTGAGVGAVVMPEAAAKATVTVTGELKSEIGYGLWQGAGTAILNGAEVNAATGIHIFGGKITLNDATINADGAYATSKNGLATLMSGAAMQVLSTNTKKNVESINIKNSSLASENGHAIYVYGNTQGDGTEDLGDFILENVKLTAKDDDTYVLAKSGDKNKPGFAKYLVDGREHSALALDTTFGSYDTLAGAAQGSDKPTTDAGEEAENPNTADTIATYMTIAAVALLGLGATAFVAKKSNR